MRTSCGTAPIRYSPFAIRPPIARDMPRILVTPLSAIEDTIREHRPSRLVSLLSPEHMIETHPELGEARHLRLGVQDIADPAAGPVPPAAHHVLRLIEFGRSWDAAEPMLIHCWAG